MFSSETSDSGTLTQLKATSLEFGNAQIIASARRCNKYVQMYYDWRSLTGRGKKINASG